MINEETLRYWAMFGFKLGRMEFIWGSNYPEVAAEFIKAKQELDSMLSGEFEPGETDFRHFSNSILMFYQKNNIEIYSSILIGICIQRYWLGKSIDNKQNSRMLLDLAHSTLEGIPERVVPDKSIVFAAIAMAESDSLMSAISKIYEALKITSTTETENISTPHANNSTSKGYIFISYSSKDNDVAQKIKNNLLKEGVQYWIAPESIPIGSEYTEVIVNAIENSMGVILILSDNSQKSVWVPKELDIALSSEKVIFPIHIDRSNLEPKMRFRLSNSQVEECYDKINTDFCSVIRSIKEQL